MNLFCNEVNNIVCFVNCKPFKKSRKRDMIYLCVQDSESSVIVQIMEERTCNFH